MHTTNAFSGWGLGSRKYVNAEEMACQEGGREGHSQDPKVGIRV